VVSGWRVIRARSLARRVLLGWLSAEWIGILAAYSVAIFAFSFLIGDLLVRLGPMTLVFLPLVLAVPIGAVFLVRRAARLPQELVRQARRPIDATGPSPTLTVQPSPTPVEWHAIGLLRRFDTVVTARQHGTISSGSRGSNSPGPDLLRAAAPPDDLRVIEIPAQARPEPAVDPRTALGGALETRPVELGENSTQVPIASVNTATKRGD
jgi:hypothetical protein